MKNNVEMSNVHIYVKLAKYSRLLKAQIIKSWPKSMKPNLWRNLTYTDISNKVPLKNPNKKKRFQLPAFFTISSNANAEKVLSPSRQSKAFHVHRVLCNVPWGSMIHLHKKPATWTKIPMDFHPMMGWFCFFFPIRKLFRFCRRKAMASNKLQESGETSLL